MKGDEDPVFPWLSQYGSNHHQWRKACHDDRDVFYRPLGFIENAFDSDGLYFEGRADVNVSLNLEARVPADWSEQQLRRHILLVWTALRLHHVLLFVKAVPKKDYMVCDARHSRDRVFVIHQPNTEDEAIQNAAQSLVFMGDHYTKAVPAQVNRHAQNTRRVFDEREAMARLIVLPTETLSEERRSIRMLLVMGHSITDGLTNGAWTIHLTELLNSPTAAIESSLPALVSSVQSRLPVPQEDHYPLLPGSRARRRWFWALTVVLRHVRKPLPAAFANPLRRAQPLQVAQKPSPEFDRVFDYSRSPPLNTFMQSIRVSTPATKRLHRLCREAHASIGAGCFVLVAISMMELYETLHPSILLEDRQPFIGSFPINPRPFFNHTSAPNSMMLSFSDGVVLPFLHSSLDLDARIRLLVRSAHRQLGQYQKRAPAQVADPKLDMTSRGSGRVIAMNYIAAVERTEAKLPPHLRTPGYVSPQGELAVRPNPTMATCGVSSVGRINPALKAGRYDLDATLRAGENVLIADIRSFTQGVRARDGEFLVGISGDDEGIGANVSYDGNATDPELVENWARKIEDLLEDDNVKARL